MQNYQMSIKNYMTYLANIFLLWNQTNCHILKMIHQLWTRVNKFSEFIKSKYKDSCSNILICSHMSPVNFLINEFSEDLNRQMMGPVHMW